MNTVQAAFATFIVSIGLVVLPSGAAVGAAPTRTTAATSYWTSDASGEKPGLAPLAQVWGSCGNSAAASKIVRRFTRHRASTTAGVFNGGETRLRCGTSRSGYRHILANHDDQWAAYAALGGMNWRDFADDSMAAALTDPDVVKARHSNDSFGFQRQMYLYRNGNRVGTATTCTAVTHAIDNNVITAFPGACPGAN